jgi:Plavaka transposase
MSFLGTPCNERGEYLPPYTRPPPTSTSTNADNNNAWHPFSSRIEFDVAHHHFVEAQHSARNIDRALDIWVASVMEYGGDAPWKDSAHLYATIDAIQNGDSPWKVYRIHYKGPCPPGTPPKWMTETYELCTRDSRQVLHHQLSTTQFKDKFNKAPYHQTNNKGERTWSNLMSADWAWNQAVCNMDLRYIKTDTKSRQDEIAKDRSTHGAMFVPVVAGSDKTTVSVATGHQEYHPVYMSPGNLTNVARRSHGNALLPVAFLPIPKSEYLASSSQREYDLIYTYSLKKAPENSKVPKVLSPNVS